MAVQGSELLDIPVGAIGRASAPIAGRFPVPMSAYGFLIDFEAELALDRLDILGGKFISGALTPESIYGEPTIGQIWPR